MRIIGLTGGIGSGKSTVSGMLRDLGAAVVDGDMGARAVVEPGEPALREIVKEFGESVLRPDGGLDRRAVAERVFSDEAARLRLNAITHPRVREWMAARVGEAVGGGAEIVVMDIPLLYESTLGDEVSEVIVVWVPMEVQAQRAMSRGMDEGDVQARIRAQMPIDDKRRRATHLIDNSGSIEATRAQVQSLWRQLTDPARDSA